MDMNVHFERRHTIYLTYTSAASCGRQVIDRKQNEYNAPSDKNTLASVIVIDI